MGERVKKYLKNEFQFEKFSLDHENQLDFYLCCWQRNRSIVPSLLLRTLIFVGCVAILVSSFVITLQEMRLGLWFIFMTHWGLMLITLTSGLAFTVSVLAFFKVSMESALPVCVKMYWILFNSTITIALFITVFYWIFLTQLTEDYGMDPVLDVFVHAINSVMMLLLLFTSRHPVRLMHFYLPLFLGIIYMLFSLIFYFAGGVSPFGTRWIYPMLDWSQPGQTVLLVFGSAIAMVVLHAFVVSMAICRDALTKRCRDSTVLSISDERYN